MPSEWIAFSNKLLNKFATSSEIISLFSTSYIFEKVVTLSDENAFNIFPEFLVISDIT